MKKIFLAIVTVLGLFSATSCSDMLETDSSRQLFDPELSEKSDSVFYALGVLEAMQQVADQYVFLGEMRGDNVTTTDYTDNNLRQLADFSATTSNKYDSAYVYYRIINNCNYYVAHRDTSLLTGSTAVTMKEYVAMKSIRAWAYMQLVRNYGSVPFFTEPLTKISQIENANFPEYNLSQIVAALAPDLEQYTGYNVPDYGSISAGSTNRGQAKSVSSSKCFIPVDVILGEMYLEDGQYDKAASHYTTYLIDVNPTTNNFIAPMSLNRFSNMPSDYSRSLSTTTTWSNIFNNNSVTDIISYIPMAVNNQRGTTTNVPDAFGYNYYAISSSDVYQDEIQIEPTKDYLNATDTARYYYYATTTGVANSACGSANLGDMRAKACMTYGEGEDSTKIWVSKYNSGNVILYRLSTIWLHLSEALNRLGYPDAAFAILKDGLQDYTYTYSTYLSDETKQLLQTTYPFFSEANTSKFTNDLYSGIHARGAGLTTDANFPGRSGYQYGTVLADKLSKIASDYNVSVGATKEDSINAMEDILADEYQLEFAFEGTRWHDLMRLARHKNNAGTYSSTFGNTWLARKIAYKNPSKDMTDQNNWYLPFK